ncbi:MAG: tetratricopeptide repeat protein, partial [Pseudolabrys sp.]
HFEEAIRMSRELDMPGHLARSLLGLGQLHKMKGRTEEAHTCLEEARDIAKRAGAPNVSSKIHAGLGSL